MFGLPPCKIVLYEFEHCEFALWEYKPCQIELAMNAIYFYNLCRACLGYNRIFLIPEQTFDRLLKDWYTTKTFNHIDFSIKLIKKMAINNKLPLWRNTYPSIWYFTKVLYKICKNGAFSQTFVWRNDISTAAQVKKRTEVRSHHHVYSSIWFFRKRR